MQGTPTISRILNISAGPFRGHQAAKRNMVQSACPESFQSFKSQVESQVAHAIIIQSQIEHQVFLFVSSHPIYN